MSVDSVDRGTDHLMLQICRRMAKHVHTNLVTCDLIDMLHTEAAGVSEQSQLQVDLMETDDADVVERTM